MAISFDSIGQVCVTAAVSGQVAPGCPVAYTGCCQVSPCADNGKIHGIVASYADGYAAVTLRGFVTVPYTGSAPAVGFTALAAAGANAVKASGTTAYLVVDVDTVNQTVTFLL